MIIATHPFATRITEQQLRERFRSLTQWEERYRQLILLARELPALPESLRQQQYQLEGCENQVWLGHQLLADDRLHFYGDSDGRIVRGLLAILLTAVEGKTAQQLLNFDPLPLFKELGIEQQLSSSRVQGLNSLIDAIRQIARGYVAGG